MEEKREAKPELKPELKPEQGAGKKTIQAAVGVLGVLMLGCVMAIEGQSNAPLGEENLATVTSQGEVLLEVDLNQVETPYEWEVGEETGQYNLILIETGCISVSKANCPDQICVLQGASGAEGRPIVCLPHQLVITLKGGDVADGFAG